MLSDQGKRLETLVSHFFIEGQAPYLKPSWGLGDGLGGGVEGVNRRDRRLPPLHRKQVIGRYVGPANIGIFEIIIYFNNNYIFRSLLRIEIIF
jgi:hypothetical protein